LEEDGSAADETDLGTASSTAMLDNPALYDPSKLGARLHTIFGPAASSASNVEGTEGLSELCWTSQLRRMFVLVGRCMMAGEPVLLVGETGAGKTSVVQLYARLLLRRLRIVNCHQNMDATDFLGSLRPVRPSRRSQVGGELVDLIRKWGNLPSIASVPAIQDSGAVEASSSSSSAVENSPSLVPASPSDAMAWFRKRCKDLDTAAALAMSSGVKRKRDDIADEGKGATCREQDASKASKVPRTEATDEKSPHRITQAPGGTSQEESAASDRDAIVQKWKEFTALFEWADGPLIDSMMDGSLFLLDEISLAEDAVLERLNSVLEPGRTITIPERTQSGSPKGLENADPTSVRAHPSFRFIATMNPGGDFGKRELSPALRSRFTEVWIP